MHTNDRKALADHLGLPLDQFDKLLASANYAYNTFKDMGPFYGKETVKDPTFRVTAQPVTLPHHAKKQIIEFGDDAVVLGKALKNIPSKYKDKLGKGLDYKVPPTWRFDAILDEKGDLRVNEIEGVDGASALLIAEQIAYNLGAIDRSAASYLVSTYKEGYFKKKSVRIALILRTNYPHKMNSKQFIALLDKCSKGDVRVDLYEEAEIREKSVKPEWKSYDGVINESTFFLHELLELGIRDEQLIAAGNYNALISKGVFALIFDENLKDFWHKELGSKRLARLQDILIPSKFIDTEKALDQARKEGNVIKIYWAPFERVVVNRAIGVAMPEGDLKHSDEKRWKEISEYMKQGFKIIAQEYVRPARIKAYLRKKNTNLEAVEWYNRVCAKYVCTDNPNKATLPRVVMTGVEVTLGPDVVPAGRACAFTAGKFSEK